MKRTYVDGELFLYRGRELRLYRLPAIAPDCREAVSSDGDRLILQMPPTAGPEACRRRLLFWYVAESEQIIRELVPAWSKTIQVRPRSAAVREMRTRWGSCSADGSIRFNARLSMLSNEVAHYLVVHELCHLKHMNHSRAFWDEVDAALPGSKALRRKLREEEQKTLF